MTAVAPLPSTLHFTSPHSTTTTTTTTTTTKPTTNPVSGDVSASLSFYAPTVDGEPPYHYVESPPAGIPSTNEAEHHQIVTIHDLRGLESNFNLDKQAFQPISNIPSAETSFTDEDRIQNIYYPEIESIVLKHIPGAQQVVIFDHTIRRSLPGSNRAPVKRVHIDQTHEAGYSRIRRHLPEERANEVIEKGIRARIINVWRPINGPVVDNPLALADSRSVKDEDVLSVRHIYPDREGGTLTVRYHPEQKWWYWSGQRNDEVVLIKCFDTDTKVGGGSEGRRGRTPHTAFEHPGTPEEKRNGRESIEVRCLVIG